MKRSSSISFILACFLFFPFAGLTQDSIHGVSDTGTQEILIGKLNRLDLQTGNLGTSFLKEYQTYQPCSKVLVDLGPKIYELKTTIVLGTWCHDSQEQVPRLFKILDKINYNTNNLEIIGLDKGKSVENIDISELNIELVPTIIFFKDDIEVGRIVETPELSLEDDILNISVE